MALAPERARVRLRQPPAVSRRFGSPPVRSEPMAGDHRSRRRQPSHDDRRIRPRLQGAHQLLDLALRLVRRRSQYRDMVLTREVRRQQPHRRQGDRALLEQLEDQRVTARGSRGLDAVVGRPFGKVQHLGAVTEHRRAPFSQVQPSGIDLHQRAQQRRRGEMLFDDQCFAASSSARSSRLVNRVACLAISTCSTRSFSAAGCTVCRDRPAVCRARPFDRQSHAHGHRRQ